MIISVMSPFHLAKSWASFDEETHQTRSKTSRVHSTGKIIQNGSKLRQLWQLVAARCMGGFGGRDVFGDCSPCSVWCNALSVDESCRYHGPLPESLKIQECLCELCHSNCGVCSKSIAFFSFFCSHSRRHLENGSECFNLLIQTDIFCVANMIQRQRERGKQGCYIEIFTNTDLWGGLIGLAMSAMRWINQFLKFVVKVVWPSSSSSGCRQGRQSSFGISKNKSK